MRRPILIVTALALLVACGKSAPTPVTAPGGTDSGDPATWIERHVAEGWFPAPASVSDAMPTDSEGGIDLEGRQDRGLARTISRLDGDELEEDGPLEEVEHSVADPVIRDERASGESGGGESLGDPRFNSDAPFEAPEASPRFGGAGGGGGAPETANSGDDTADEPTTTWKRSDLTPNASQLRVGDDVTLPLESFQATVRVDGFRARVVLDLVYRSTLDFDAEGAFRLRLPDESAVHYLAFGEAAAAAPFIAPPTVGSPDFGAPGVTAARGGSPQMREARLVPREQAQRAYARETARNVDPALLEWSGAGVFSTRVFPITAGQTHRITVAYDTDLVATADALAFDLDVPADAGTAQVDVFTDGAWRQLGRPADGRVALSFPNPSGSVLVGTDAALGAHFATALVPEIPATPGAPNARAVFVVDASMSSNPERMNVWARLLRQVLERNRDDLQEFAVLFFNVEQWWWRPHLAANDEETVDALLDDVQRLALEGATDVGAALREAAAPAWEQGALEADLFLLSDGAATWGADDAEIAAADAGRPVFCYATGLAGTNVRGLQAIARAAGGAVFTVVGADAVPAAAVAHRSRPWNLRAIEVAGCSDVIAAGRPVTLHPGQRLRIAGRGAPRPGDTITLVLEQGGRRHDVVMPVQGIVASPLASRAYGEIATGQLEDLAPLADEQARAYALHYGVAGKTCSLLMLESEEAYARYDIAPQDDAAVVRQHPVRAVVAAMAEARRRAAADTREAFLLLLDRLERVSGVVFDDLDSLRDAVRRLPPEALAPPASALRARTRWWDDVSRPFRKELQAASPTYDEALREAEGRRSVRTADDALRALSCLIEAEPGSTDLLRDVAVTALAWERPGAAYGLLRRVADLRPDQPETWRLMAECLERTGRIDAAVLVHEITLRGAWDGRFGAFPLIAAMDYARLLERIDRGEVACALPALTDAARARIAELYVQDLPGLAITMTWNTDRTDIDLHVIDPAGEECFYSHPRTKAGGAITRDVTTGLGPEMFLAGTPLPGEYRIDATYYAADGSRGRLRSRVFATVVRRMSDGALDVTRHALTLEQGKDRAEIARIVWE